MGRTLVSFNFDNAEPICISIEARPEKGGGFAPIASLFKQFDLIYVVGDERDIAGVRATHRNEDVFLQRIRIDAATARRFLLVYLARVHELADRPEFYHLLKNNRTINIVRTGRLSINHVLNGFIDRYLFSAGMIETDLPFEELRRRPHINEAAIKADGATDFAHRIREAIGVPEFRRTAGADDVFTNPL